MDRSLSCRKLLVSSGLSSSLASWDQLSVLSPLLPGGLGTSSEDLPSVKTSASGTSLAPRPPLQMVRCYYRSASTRQLYVGTVWAALSSKDLSHSESDALRHGQSLSFRRIPLLVPWISFRLMLQKLPHLCI